MTRAGGGAQLRLSSGDCTGASGARPGRGSPGHGIPARDLRPRDHPARARPGARSGPCGSARRASAGAPAQCGQSRGRPDARALDRAAGAGCRRRREGGREDRHRDVPLDGRGDRGGGQGARAQPCVAGELGDDRQVHRTRRGAQRAGDVGVDHRGRELQAGARAEHARRRVPAHVPRGAGGPGHGHRRRGGDGRLARAREAAGGYPRAARHAQAEPATAPRRSSRSRRRRRRTWTAA